VKKPFGFMMTAKSHEKMLGKIPKHYTKQQFLDRVVEFVLRTKRPQDLVRSIPRKDVKEQVRLTKEQRDALHARADELGLSVGELLNAGIMEASIHHSPEERGYSKSKKAKHETDSIEESNGHLHQGEGEGLQSDSTLQGRDEPGEGEPQTSP